MNSDAKEGNDLETFRIAVGKSHGVEARNIVGAIANEAEIDSEYIGRVEIFDDHSTVDLPEGMPKQLMKKNYCKALIPLLLI